MNEDGLPYKDVFKKTLRSDDETPDDAPRHGAKTWHGVVAAIVTLIMLIFAGGMLQYYLGMAGLALTELMILGFVVFFCLIFRQDLREVFRMKLPSRRQIGATVVAWMGFSGISMVIALFIACFFPSEATAVSEGISDFISTVPFGASLLITALMPAVCEEAMFRGFIQHSFSGLNRWVRAILVAVLFGIFHLDPVRIVPTAVLGFGLAYIMMKTDNLLLPMLFHFINNALPTILVYLIKEASPELTEAAASSVYTFDQALMNLMTFVGCPALIVVSGILFEPRRPNTPGRFRDKRPQITAAAAVTALMFIGYMIGSSRLLVG